MQKSNGEWRLIVDYPGLEWSLGVGSGVAAAGADLGHSSKYLNENFEGFLLPVFIFQQTYGTIQWVVKHSNAEIHI